MSAVVQWAGAHPALTAVILAAGIVAITAILAYRDSAASRPQTRRAGVPASDVGDSSSFLNAKDLAELRQIAKDNLGTLVRLGNEIIGGHNQAIAEKWATVSRDYIRAAYGEAEAQLFLSDAGYIFLSGSGGVRNFIDGRHRRLTDLISRVVGLDLQANCVLGDWVKEIAAFSHQASHPLNDEGEVVIRTT